MIEPPLPTPDPPCDVDLLVLFSVGELDPVRRDILTAHLIDCDRCWREIQFQRAAIGVVQTLWEPAPPGLRGNIRAAISDPHIRPRRDRRSLVAVAAALVVALGVGGAVTDRLITHPRHREVEATASVPASVQAAISQAGGTPPVDPAVRPGPTLITAGLRLTASGTTTAGGTPAAVYTYADRAGHRITVFVAVRTWPRPAPATTVSSRTWLFIPDTPLPPTVVGGPDRAGENMLVIAPDHTAAMTAAAQLGLL